MIIGTADHHACGPLDVEIVSGSESLRRKITDTLDLYNVEWPGPRASIRLEIRESESVAELGPGKYLACARMHVDPLDRSTDGTLESTFRCGAVATGNPASGRWEIRVPRDGDDFWILIDLESLVSLILTEGWRSAGWVPVHAGAVVRLGTCALLCAESGGGKTSLTAALIRRGWQTLGDDKLLLRVREDGTPELRALVHTFNLHPRTRGWFPEVGDLETLPTYSGWTEKRKVNPEDIWRGTTLTHATPTHLIAITRNVTGKPVNVIRMQSGEVLSTLLHQTVVPSDRAVARQVLSTVAGTSRQLDGISVDLGDDVYSDPEQLALLEAELS